ncbi:MAG: hypothetical protein FWH34_08360 [Desulfovibrionaceae bacterium]|nr:hypothetical protein [Desulfovibrionaceae bacterium]
MFNLFQKTSAPWVKYSEYVIREARDGNRYIRPSSKARVAVYDPLKDTEALVVDALNVGLLHMSSSKQAMAEAATMEFVHKYGLLGLVTALPTTPDFMEYEMVYLPKNQFIKTDAMPKKEYASLFFPFYRPEYLKGDDEPHYDMPIDRDALALAFTFTNKPLGMTMSFELAYAERYDWLALQFKDWAFTFLSSVFYYEDYENSDEKTRNLYRSSMAAFGGATPTYRVSLLDKPTILWDFHSLLLGIQMMFSFALTGDAKPLRLCRHCQKMFIARHPNAAFCSPQCKNQHNVYKSRAKKAEGEKNA